MEEAQLLVKGEEPAIIILASRDSVSFLSYAYLLRSELTVLQPIRFLRCY